MGPDEANIDVALLNLIDDPFVTQVDLPGTGLSE